MSTYRMFFTTFVAFMLIEQIVAPPAAIKKNQNAEHEKHAAIETNEVEEMLADEEFNVEYQRYLKEVISTLETDEAFKKKVEEASKTDFDSGQIANELAMVNHNVRSKLDELKRKEVERLRQLVRELDSRGKGNSLHPSQYEHIDHHNLDTFEIKDLDNLIKKVSKDIDEINQMRRKQFKEYEMEKHFEDEMKMKNMTETEKKEYQQHLEDMKKKHANHEKVHHPGSKAQFEEVWEKQDQLESQEFDPKTFFYLHDMDGNGYWDINEVNALFVKELDKLYQSGLPEDDMRERHEEMERMREHVFSEMDKNHDNMISLEEYMEETKTKEFNQDEGWETLENQQIYTQQEYEEFEKRRMQQIQEMMDRGYILHPDVPNVLIRPENSSDQLLISHMKPINRTHYEYHHPGAGYYPQGPGPNGMPVQYHPESQYGYQAHPNQQGYHPNQQGYHPNQMNPQGYHPNQMHPSQVNMNQHPNQMHPNQVNMNQHPNQMNQHPNQMNQYPNQMNQYPNQMDHHPNQVNQYPNQVNQHPNQMNQHPNQVNQHPNLVNQHPNQVNQQHQQAGGQSNEVHQNSNQQQPISNNMNNQVPNSGNLPPQPPSPANSGGANPQTNQVNNQGYQQQQAYQQPPNPQAYQQPPNQANQPSYQQPSNQQAYQPPPNQQAYQQQNVQQPPHQQQQASPNKNQQYNQQAHH